MEELTHPELWQELQARGIELRPPRTREQCMELPRPCTRLRCRYNLHTDVNRRGRLQVVSQPDKGRPSCALDVAEAGGVTLEEVGNYLDVTRERVRQIELHALKKLRRLVLPSYDLRQMAVVAIAASIGMRQTRGQYKSQPERHSLLREPEVAEPRGEQE